MVLIAHKHKFVLLKTNKTAGTSVEMFLQSACVAPGTNIIESQRATVTDDYIVGMRMVPREERMPIDNIWYNHMPAAAVRSQLAPEVWDAYEKICCVRNPFDLAVSRFHYRRRLRGEPSLQNDKAALREAFKKTVLETHWTNSKKETHIGGELVAERFIRFEHLKEDLDQLCQDYSLDANPSALPVTKRTTDDRLGLHFRDYYDDETVDFVRNHFHWMLKAGNYPDTPDETLH